MTYPSLDGSLVVTSHLYEYLMREQYEGWVFHLNYRGQNKGLGSQLDMNRYRADLKSLWNLGGVFSASILFWVQELKES